MGEFIIYIQKMPSPEYTYEWKADRAKEKIKETFWDDLNNLQVQTATTIIQTAITAMKDGTTMKDYYLWQWAWLVIAVQILMKQWWLYPFQLDGIMWPQFKNCVKNFQSKNWLIPDAQLSTSTLQKLLSIIKLETTSVPKATEKTLKRETITYDKDSYDIINGVITIDWVSYDDADKKTNFTGKWYQKGIDFIYIWEYENGKLEWKWTLTQSDWSKYIWDWKNDLFEWKWIFTRPEWTKYIWDWNDVWDWKNNKREWVWTFTQSEWTKYVWDWENGMREWKWTSTRLDWSKYVWDYKNDKIDWKWTYTNPYNKSFRWTRKEDHLINNKKRLLSIGELDEVKDKNEFGKIANLAPNII